VVALRSADVLPIHRVNRREAELRRAIVEAVAYADVFDWPLTPGEIRRDLPIAARQVEVDLALASPLMRETVWARDGLVTLAGREWLAPRRRGSAASSARLWSRARPWLTLIAALPFVRLVAISGSLAVAAAADDADVDLFIVTDDGRLWLARALTIAVVRLAARRDMHLCPNYLLARSALALPERDRFTAHELAQLVTVAADETHAELLAANPWYRGHLPNHPGPPPPVRGLPWPGLKPHVERLLRRPVFDRLEAREMGRKAARLRAAAGTNVEARFDRQVCKGHLGEHRRRTLRAFGERVERLARLESVP
jgi:hypothetical protein